MSRPHRGWSGTLLLPCVVALAGAGLAARQLSPADRQQLQNVHVGGGTMMPAFKKEILPHYLVGAVAAGVQGDVDLEVVVGRDGRVIHARIAKSLDEKFGLDHEALEAAERCQFKPAVDDAGSAMTVLVALRVTFGMSGHTPRVTAKVAEVSRQPLAPPDPGTPATPMYTSKTPGFVDLKAVRSVQPQYTAAAIRAKIVGTVNVEIVILADGTVGSARLVKSLDPGLDQAALVAARYWIFEPATLNGQPVATRATLSLEFKMMR